MKEYEVKIENRKNSIWSDFKEPITMILRANNKQQAKDFAFEIFAETYWKISREKVKITAESI